MDETKLLENINNLICVFKINLNRIGLERHEGEENNDRIFIYRLIIPFGKKCIMFHRLPLYLYYCKLRDKSKILSVLINSICGILSIRRKLDSVKPEHVLQQEWRHILTLACACLALHCLLHD